MNYLNVIFCLIFCFLPIVLSFSWQSCGDDKYLMKITNLNINSTRNQMLYITGKAKVAKEITFPLTAKLQIFRKLFWAWAEIPCVDGVGSCEYLDICTASPYLDTDCPPEFTTNEIPCKCPIEVGQYMVKRFPLNIKLLPEWLQSGEYKIKIVLSHRKEDVLCLLMSIAI